jgi:TonB family protein
VHFRRALSIGLVSFLPFLGLPQTSEEPLPVGGSIARPKRIRFVEPRYPDDARAQGLQSVVILELTLTPEGSVREVRPLRGAPELLSAAIEAARQWVYEPTLVEGRAVSLRFAETVLFVLRRSSERGGNGMFLRPPDPNASYASFPDWEIEGEAFTACPCDTPCPCRSNAPPSHPPCHATTTQRLERGHYGDVDLAGATWVSLGPENWTALYFSQQMTAVQQKAVLDLYSSLVPGAPQVYRLLKAARVDFEATGPMRRVVIPGVLEVESEAPLGPDGRLQGLIPGMDVWSNWLAYGKTGVYRYNDPALGESWDHSHRQSNHKRFRVSKADYENRRMLIQHGDGSGDWTAGQERILACLRK